MSEEIGSAESWVRDAFRSLVFELRFYFRTLGGFLRNPKEFTQGWLSGELRLMNPLGYLGMCLLFVAPVEFFLGIRMRPMWDKLEAATKIHINSDLLDLWKSAGHYVLPLLICLLIHPYLRLLGSKRRLSITLGVLFYLYGAQMLVTWILFPYRYFVVYTSPTIEVLNQRDLVAGFLVFPTLMYFGGRGLSGAHGLRFWRTALAIVLSLLTLGALALGAGLAWNALHPGAHAAPITH